jgi:acid phosphatase (class A)
MNTTEREYKISVLRRSFIFTVLVGSLLIIGCVPVKYKVLVKDIKETYPGQPEGYLSSFELPNSRSLLPPPPQPGSSAMKVDQEISDMYLNSDDSLRWRQAQVDANLDFPTGIDSFAEILHTKISLETAPHLYLLLTRVVEDASLSTASAKIYYMRQRPFIVNEQPTCDPEAEPYLRRSGAYPSGHSAIGWTWALILCEIFPEQTNEILIRGREFGESRAVCNLHWHSDVVEGRFMGSATVAALHGNSEFQHDLKKAKQELKRIISNNR